MRAHPAGKLGEGATAVTGTELCERLFQSTPPARGATALLAVVPGGVLISIHAPARGATRDDLSQSLSGFTFQSTPPRGGDVSGGGLTMLHRDFNPRPREGGDSSSAPTLINKKDFNPRPREGGDASSYAAPPRIALFQSTPPARGATGHRNDRLLEIAISIHAPREGGDSTMRSRIVARVISIHAPREGGRRRLSFDSHLGDSFQSTPPARGATEYPPALQGCASFQSTPPARGATSNSGKTAPSESFQSTPPRGGRPPVSGSVTASTWISIHAPARGAT